jgi:hypothetical protein
MLVHCFLSGALAVLLLGTAGCSDEKRSATTTEEPTPVVAQNSSPEHTEAVKRFEGWIREQRPDADQIWDVRCLATEIDRFGCNGKAGTPRDYVIATGEVVNGNVSPASKVVPLPGGQKPESNGASSG